MRKAGLEMPRSARTESERSGRVLRRTAPMMPATMPTTMAIRIAAPISRSVGPMRAAMRPATGSLKRCSE